MRILLIEDDGMIGRSLDRALTDRVHAGPACGEAEHGPPAIGRILGPRQQPLRHQPLEHAGQRARMDVHHARQVSRRQAREQPDDAKHEPLRAGHPDVAAHPERRPPPGAGRVPNPRDAKLVRGTGAKMLKDLFELLPDFPRPTSRTGGTNRRR